MQEIIIDTDAGVDDAVAILMALNWPGAEIIAITTVAGNVDEPQVAVNVAKILAYTSCTHIPVYRGCESPLIGSRASSLTWAGHGMDGLGDVPEELLGLSVDVRHLVPRKSLLFQLHPAPPQQSPLSSASASVSLAAGGSSALASGPVQTGSSASGALPSSTSLLDCKDQQDDKIPTREHAVLALIRLIHSHPDATLVMIGPLTNLAMALKLDPTLAAALSNRPNRLVIMGGSLTGSGNVSLTAEYNFREDPEAAHIVLSACTRADSVILVPLEFCREQALTWSHFDQILANETVFARLLNLITKAYEKVCRHRVQRGGVSAVAVATSRATNGSSGSLAHSNYVSTQTILHTTANSDSGPKRDAAEASGSLAQGKETDASAREAHRKQIQEVATAAALGATEKAVAASFGNSQTDALEEGLSGTEDDGRFTPYDAFAVAVALEPELITQQRAVFATIELGGSLTRGMLVIDWNKRSGNAPNVTAAQKMSSSRIEEIMLRSFRSW